MLPVRLHLPANLPPRLLLEVWKPLRSLWRKVLYPLARKDRLQRMPRAHIQASVYDPISPLQNPRKKVRSRRRIHIPRLCPTKRTQSILTLPTPIQLCETVPTISLTRPMDLRILLLRVEEEEDGDEEGEGEEVVAEDVAGADHLDINHRQLRTLFNLHLSGDNHLERRTGLKRPLLRSRWTLSLDTYIHTSLIFVDSKDITSSKRASHRSDMA